MGDAPPTTDDAAARSVEALQAAAQEMIAAARAMLDVADGLVRDPRSAGGLLSLLGTVVRSASDVAGTARARHDRGAGDADDDENDDDEGDGRVQRIPVS